MVVGGKSTSSTYVVAITKGNTAMFEHGSPTRFAFRIHGVGKVIAEIGDVTRREGDIGRYDHRHSYPEYRVTIGDVVIEGNDYGVPAGSATDSLDSAITLLSLLAHEESEREAERFDVESVELWAMDRRTVRDALRAPWRSTPARDVVRAVYAGEM